MDDSSKTVTEPTKEKLDQAEDGRVSPTESEYNSADGSSYSDNKVRELPKETDSETDGSIAQERESGDGEESLPPKKVDDDEDKKNPQYIPKRGTFYEHDDRTAEDLEETIEPEVEKLEKDVKKKVWQDKKEKWSHDKFKDTDQAPKSRAELIAIYGYDIRNEDGPPRARRRRRYGRGPNKYTRNWEDEDAYNKPPPSRTKKLPKKPNHAEDFPPLSGQESDDVRKHEYDRSTQETENQWDNTSNVLSNPSSSSFNNENSNKVVNQDYANKNRIGSGRMNKSKKDIKDSDYKGFTTKGRNIFDQKVVVKPSYRNDDFVQSQNFTNKNHKTYELEKGMGKMNLDTYKGSGKQGNQGRQGSVPPRLQGEQKGSKRYSSLRQRSLPDATNPPFNQHSNYYPNEYNQQSHLNHPSTTQIPPLAPLPQQVPVTATPILPAPQFGAPFPPAPPPFLQAGVAPPPFISPQTPQIINYVPGQPQFSQGYQGFQQQYNSVTPPDGMYQPQTGITYYSTDQQISQRTVPQKRPKAAIPIVAPPSVDIKGRNKGEDESEITEHIIENSNLRKDIIKQ